ncbi:LamG-like jellyroll fold domain-containing protein [Lacinutrix undariae]
MNLKNYFFILVFLCHFMSFGQTLDQQNIADVTTDLSSSDDNLGGQSFTAGLTGKLSQVNFKVKRNTSNILDVNFEIAIYEGDGYTGNLLGTASKAMFLGGEGISIHEVTVPISTDIAVVSGTMYTFRIYNPNTQNNPDIQNLDIQTTGNDYEDGIIYYSNGQNGFASFADLWFKTYVTEGIPGPTVEAQSFCVGATVDDLVATGTNLQWYSSETSTYALSDNSSLYTSTFYVSQIVDGTESDRIAVSVTIYNAGSAPSVDSPVIYIQGDTAIPLTTNYYGEGQLWYTSAIGGEGSTEAPTPDTSELGSTSYWVAIQNDFGCETDRSELVVNIVEYSVGDYAKFDVDTYSTFANSIDVTGDFTIETWVKPTIGSTYIDDEYNVDSEEIAGGTIISGIINIEANNNSVFNVDQYGQLVFAIFGNMETEPDLLFSVNSITGDNWHHIAVTRSAGVYSLYIDGILDNSSSDLPLIDLSFLGIGAPQAMPFSGGIDDLRIWSVAKTENELATNKNCELSGTETGLLAYYKFNQGIANGDNTTETVIIDASSNANHASLNGFDLSGTSSNFLSGSLVGPKATITVQPQYQTLSATDESISFSVTATNANTYQWQIGFDYPEGVQWESLSDGFTDPEVSGATTNTLTFSGEGLSIINEFKFRVVINGSTSCETISNEVEITETTLGLVSNELENVKIFPNPTHNTVSIALPNAEDTKISVYDLNGRLLLQQSHTSAQININLATYAVGVYLLKVETNNSEVIKRVIKQ